MAHFQIVEEEDSAVTNYAEDRAYWNTQIDPERTASEIIALLGRFGFIVQRPLKVRFTDGGLGWLLRFFSERRRRAYHLLVRALPTRGQPDHYRTIRGRQITFRERALWQALRWLLHYLKHLMECSAFVEPDRALAGFMELPEAGEGPGGLPPTVADLSAEELPGLQSLALSPGSDDVIEGDFEVDDGSGE